jgi:hypothetical protein
MDNKGLSIYRFFAEAHHAEALLLGNVWISTLSSCRNYEDPKQGDPEEAHETYYSGYAVGGSDDPRFVEVANRSGIKIGSNCIDIQISNCRRRTSIPDAYVLCTTTDYSPEKFSGTFGSNCVKITNIKRFFIAISNEIKKSNAIREFCAGKVIYKQRSYCEMECPPGKIGFVKPYDLYSEQKEFRFLWIPEKTDKLQPFLLKCPGISAYCSLQQRVR